MPPTPPTSAAPRYFSAALLLMAIAVALLIFGLLAEDIVEREAIAFDVPILLWLRARATAPLDLLMKVVTWLGSVWVVLPAIAAGAWRLRRARVRMVYWIAANGGAALINVLCKHGFQRLRPQFWDPLVHESTFSFPSGHAMQSMALLASLVVLLAPARRPSVIAIGGVWVAAVGVSRLYLGVHYPSDILAGWCASIAWCTGLAMLMRCQSGVRSEWSAWR